MKAQKIDGHQIYIQNSSRTTQVKKCSRKDKFRSADASGIVMAIRLCGRNTVKEKDVHRGWTIGTNGNSWDVDVVAERGI